MYVQDSKGSYPAASIWDPGARREDWLWYQEVACTGRPIPDVTQSAIARYLGNFNAEVLRCPSDDMAVHPQTSKPSGPYHYSYVMNQAMDGIVKKMKITMVRSPSDKILLVEEEENSINDGNWNPGTSLTSGDRDLLAIRHDSQKDQNDPRTQDFTTHRNGGKRGNVAFVDGHAEYVPRLFAHNPIHTNPALSN